MLSILTYQCIDDSEEREIELSTKQEALNYIHSIDVSLIDAWSISTYEDNQLVNYHDWSDE